MMNVLRLKEQKRGLDFSERISQEHCIYFLKQIRNIPTIAISLNLPFADSNLKLIEKGKTRSTYQTMVAKNRNSFQQTYTKFRNYFSGLDTEKGNGLKIFWPRPRGLRSLGYEVTPLHIPIGVGNSVIDNYILYNKNEGLLELHRGDLNVSTDWKIPIEFVAGLGLFSTGGLGVIFIHLTEDAPEKFKKSLARKPFLNKHFVADYAMTGRSNPRRVLIVGGSGSEVRSLAEPLYDKGFSVSWADDARGFDFAAKPEDIDLIITEWKGFGSTGIELFHRLNEQNVSIPVIVRTSRDENLNLGVLQEHYPDTIDLSFELEIMEGDETETTSNFIEKVDTLLSNWENGNLHILKENIQEEVIQDNLTNTIASILYNLSALAESQGEEARFVVTKTDEIDGRKVRSKFTDRQTGFIYVMELDHENKMFSIYIEGNEESKWSIPRSDFYDTNRGIKTALQTDKTGKTSGIKIKWEFPFKICGISCSTYRKF